jgi:hypothetical protein
VKQGIFYRHRQWFYGLSWREIVSSLLVLATLFALVPMPGSVGQSLTTIVKTVTTPVVIVDTVNSTVGTTQTRSTVLKTEAYSTPLVIQPTQGMYGCIYRNLPFAASEGEAISVDVKSSIPISIYIMTAADYGAWVAGKSCTVASSVLYSQQQVSIKFIDMIAPLTGDYDLVFLNVSPSSSANVSVDFQGVSQGFTTISVPVVTGILVTKTDTVTSTPTSVQTVTAEPLQQYGLFAIPAVLILALGLFVVRRRSGKRKVKHATSVVPDAVKFCGDCGKAIPISAQFCPECGASTEDE